MYFQIVIQMEEVEVFADVLEEDNTCIFNLFMIKYKMEMGQFILSHMFYKGENYVRNYKRYINRWNTIITIKKSGKFGPFLGSILGVFPQCGFSVSATNLYAGRVITLGTLIAVYLSTSDEMLPIFISEAVSPIIILKILGIKLVIGIVIVMKMEF